VNSRQKAGTFKELWHLHAREVYVLRFRPDQRFDALLCLDNWFRKSLVTNAKFRAMHAIILAHTWEFSNG
jgi:hypothetical protein